MNLLSALVLTLAIATAVPAHAQERSQHHYRAIDGLQLKVGQAVPDFPGPSTLASFRGKPLVINFYTVHCAPCIREIPILNALQRQNPDLQVLAITPDSPAEAAEYANRRHLMWSIATPGDNYLFNVLGVTAFPAFAILDAHGNLVSATYGSELGGEDGYATFRHHSMDQGVHPCQGKVASGLTVRPRGTLACGSRRLTQAFVAAPPKERRAKGMVRSLDGSNKPSVA